MMSASARRSNLLFDFEWANQNMYHGQYKRIASYFPNSELAATGAPSAAELASARAVQSQAPARSFQLCHRATEKR
jgi:microcin C transport system substrate-binding protein